MRNKDTTKHSHTVPVAYLANFGIDGNKKRDSMFYFYNVQENKTDTEKAGNIPVINHFYDINELGEQKQIIEKFFGDKIEGELATLLRVLLGTIINSNDVMVREKYVYDYDKVCEQLDENGYKVNEI